MKQDNLILFGRIIKPHGVKGEIRVDLKSPLTGNEKLESVFIDIDGKRVPFFIASFSDKGPFATLKLEGVDTFGSASNLKSKSCYIVVEEDTAESAEPSLDELIGFTIHDGILGDLGLVNAIEEGAQSRLVIDHDGIEMLIPFVDEIVKSIDAESKKILVDLPDGFLDIYQ